MKDPIEVAKLHYKLLEEKNYDLWITTLSRFLRETHSIPGSTAKKYWNKGTKMVDLGMKYEYLSEDVGARTETRRKFFFKRIGIDDKEVPPPVSIILIKEGEEWKVEKAEY